MKSEESQKVFYLDKRKGWEGDPPPPANYVFVLITILLLIFLFLMRAKFMPTGAV